MSGNGLPQKQFVCLEFAPHYNHIIKGGLNSEESGINYKRLLQTSSCK